MLLRDPRYIITAIIPLLSLVHSSWCLAFPSSSTLSIQPIPSQIWGESLSQTYPVTIISRLFSSVPKREFALNDVTIGFNASSDRGLTALVGASSSGKSTLFRLLSGEERPNAGNVYVNGKLLEYNSKRMNVKTPWTVTRPIVLENKPNFDSSLSVMERILQVGYDSVSLLNSSFDENNVKMPFLKALANDFINLLEFNKDKLRCKPYELNPSEQFQFGIVCSCMKSVASSSLSKDFYVTGVNYPILFFDELFDFEHSDIPQRLSQGLINLTNAGAVVVVATHKPRQLEGITGRIVTLSAGKILTDVTK